MFLLPSVNVPILGVVENMSWFTPEELPNNKYYIFGQGGGQKMANKTESVLLGQIPLVQGIREGGDEGKPVITQQENPARQAFLEMTENAMRQIDLRNQQLAPTQRVNIQS